MFGLNEKAANLLLPPDIHIELFEKMITPILLYGSEVWGYGNVEPLEIFYRAFIKRVLGLNKNTPNCPQFSMAYWQPRLQGTVETLSKPIIQATLKSAQSSTLNHT